MVKHRLRLELHNWGVGLNLSIVDYRICHTFVKSWARIPLPFRIENSQRTILNVLNYVHWNSLLSGSLKFTYYFLFLNGPIPASFFIFHYFLITISIIQIEKKCRWCAWDLNPGPQDDRRRQNHWAMAATHVSFSWFYYSKSCCIIFICFIFLH